MRTTRLQDGSETFSVSVYENDYADRVVLFGVGSGGLPERYKTLLETLAGSGCMVIAPHFDRLVSPTPSDEELMLRGRRLSLSLDEFAPTGLTVVGVGHSIGATTLVALAGAELWLGPNQQVDIATDNRLLRLSLLAPPTGFFQAPNALAELRTPIQLWVGSEDDITPPSQSTWFAGQTNDPVDLRIIEGAGHFSFMDQPPPHVTEPLQDKSTFLQSYAEEVGLFLMGS